MYVKKTALGQQTIDISGLEAPQDVPANDGDKAVTNGGSANSSECSQDSNPSAENSQTHVISESLYILLFSYPVWAGIKNILFSI